MAESVTRIVLECRSDAVDGFAYRVWSERSGQAFGEVRVNSYAAALSELLAKGERGDLHPFEPYRALSSISLNP